MISLGEFLRDARLRADLKQVEVERKAGINHKSISNWENNLSKPSSEDLIALSKLYCASIDALTGVKEAVKQTPLTAALPVVGNIIKTLAALSPAKQEQAASYIAFLAQDDKKA